MIVVYYYVGGGGGVTTLRSAWLILDNTTIISLGYSVITLLVFL